MILESEWEVGVLLSNLEVAVIAIYEVHIESQFLGSLTDDQDLNRRSYEDKLSKYVRFSKHIIVFTDEKGGI